MTFTPLRDFRELAEKPQDKQVGGSHYKDFPISPFDFVRANNVPHAEAEIIYRILRWRKKGGIEDLRKVIHTCELIIEFEGRK